MPEPRSDVIFNWTFADTLGRPLNIQTAADDSLRVEPCRLDVPWEVYSFFPLWPLFYEHATEIVIDVTYRQDAFLPQTIEQFGRDLLLWANRFSEQTPNLSLHTIASEAP
jgi:hypothetical protein